MGQGVECEHCGRPVDSGTSVGRPRKYCRRSCRQRAFEARRYLEDVSWGDAQLVRLARELAELEDRLDALGASLGELRADVEDQREVDVAAALADLELVARGGRASGRSG